MKPFDLTSATRAAGRRDFLAWMLAVPTVAGCLAPREGPSEPASGSGVGPTLPIDDDAGTVGSTAGSEGEGLTEEELRSCRATTRDAEGPYFASGSPARTVIAELDEPGVRLIVAGRILGPDCKTPLRGYAVDIWQADATGNYYDATAPNAYRLRGKVVSDGNGRYRFETVLPGRYTDGGGTRPAHLHAKILTPGGNALLTTQLYFAGDPFLGEADYCTRARACNSSDAKRVLRLVDAVVAGKGGKRASFNAIVATT